MKKEPQEYVIHQQESDLHITADQVSAHGEDYTLFWLNGEIVARIPNRTSWVREDVVLKEE